MQYFNIIVYLLVNNRQPSQQALNQAKINVIKNYLVVGITSEFEDFLSVLEKLLPEFFTGASEIYKQPGNSDHSGWKMYMLFYL